MIDHFTIYALDSEGMGITLKGIVRFGNVFMRILKLTAILGGFWIVLSMIFNFKWNIKQNIKEFSFCLFIYAMLFIPTTTVYIKDLFTKQHQQTVNNVPIVFALIGGEISKIRSYCSSKINKGKLT